MTQPKAQSEELYNPHVGAIEDNLDEPPDFSKIAKTALYYGPALKHVNLANPAGINLEGEVIEIRGEKKNRKTTLALNMARYWCSNPDRLQGGSVCWDSLESGQSPRKVKQMLVVMEATALMAQQMWGADLSGLPMLKSGADEYADMKVVRDARDPEHDPHGPGNLFRLGVSYAKAADRTPLQHWAILEARHRVSKWPLFLFGAPSKQGRTKALESPNGTRELDECLPYKRWKFAKEKLGAKIIVVDHAIAFSGSGDYDRMDKAIMHISSAVGELGLVIVVVSQTSLTSVRSGTMETRGGTRYSEEASVVFDVKYTQDEWRMMVICGEAREQPWPKLWVPVEKHSGLFFPCSYPVR